MCQELVGRKFEGETLTPGWSLDLTLNDPKTGKPWDLSEPSVQRRVKQMVRSTKPFCVIGSPPCTPFSQIQAINKKRRQRAVVEEELRKGKAHINFCLEVYAMQLVGNDIFFMNIRPDRLHGTPKR